VSKRNGSLIKDWKSLSSGREKYQCYLASREWAVLKEAVKARSSGRCERCGAEGSHVHHQTYERIYAERIEDLIHVCAPCHEFLSGKRDDDPNLSRPVEAFGRIINLVFLSGPMGYPDPARIPLPDGRWVFKHSSHPGWRSLPHYLHGHNEFKNEVKTKISMCDLLFAWFDHGQIDSLSSLLEIGFASARNIPIVVSYSHMFEPIMIQRFAMFADLLIPGSTPREAWDAFWTIVLGIEPGTPASQCQGAFIP
jgi:hypothetical protein